MRLQELGVAAGTSEVAVTYSAATSLAREGTQD
jgi:hypothetical protein